MTKPEAAATRSSIARDTSLPYRLHSKAAFSGARNDNLLDRQVSDGYSGTKSMGALSTYGALSGGNDSHSHRLARRKIPEDARRKNRHGDRAALSDSRAAPRCRRGIRDRGGILCPC